MEDKKLTICFFGSANSIHTLKWIKYFSDSNNDVYLFSYEKPLEEYPLRKIKFYFLEKKFSIQIWPLNSMLNLPIILRRVKKIIKKINPDIIHAHCVTSYGTLASKLGLHPLIVTAWGSDILINPKKYFYERFITKYVLKSADLITCDAEHMKEEMIKLGAEQSKIKIIYFGVDTKKFSPKGKNRELLGKLDIKEKEKIVISLRNLEPIYNIETLVKAVPIVLKEFPQTKFLIVGKGTEEEKLKEIAKSLNILDNILFIGWVDKEELPNYLNIADIYISTSLSDGGIASSTAEAMACGLPVVITDSGENKKWVKDGENGFVIPVKNPEILAERVVELLKDPLLGKKIGEVARETIKERNDYYAEMGKMEKIYYELIKK